MVLSTVKEESYVPTGAKENRHESPRHAPRASPPPTCTPRSPATCWSTATTSCSTSRRARAAASTTRAAAAGTSTCSRSSRRCRSGSTIPACSEPEFLAKLHARRAREPDQLRHLHRSSSPSSSTPSAASPCPTTCRTSSSSRAARWASRTRSRPRSTGRCARTSARGIREEKGQQILHFREAFHGRSGYTLSLTNTADPRKYQYFPKFDWPRIDEPEAALPGDAAELERVQQAEARRRSTQIERGVRRAQGRHRRDHHRADPGRGRRQPLPRGVPARAAATSRTRTTRCSSSTRCRPASASPAGCGRTSTSTCSPTCSRSARRRRSAA